MTTATIRLQPGDKVTVVAQDPSLKPDNTLPPPDLGFGPVDPGYGIDINAPYPDQGLPGEQPHPDQGLPPFPAHPIVLPPLPEGPITTPPGDLVPGWEKKIAWTPVTGWVVVAVPTGDHATPSRKR